MNKPWDAFRSTVELVDHGSEVGDLVQNDKCLDTELLGPQELDAELGVVLGLHDNVVESTRRPDRSVVAWVNGTEITETAVDTDVVFVLEGHQHLESTTL